MHVSDGATALVMAALQVAGRVAEERANCRATELPRTGADLRALRVECDRDRPPVEWVELFALTRGSNDRAVVLVASVREVHAHDVHALLAQRGEHLDALRVRPNGAHD